MTTEAPHRTTTGSTGSAHAEQLLEMYRRMRCFRGRASVLCKATEISGFLYLSMGQEAGTCHGSGGSMRIADPGLGIYGANGIVGASLPIATGVAAAAKVRA